MNIKTRNFVKGFILDYIEKEKNIKIDKRQKQFKCPVCEYDTPSAQIYPVNSNKITCYRPKCDCGFEGDIFDLVRKTENRPSWTDHDIALYLSKLLNFKLPNEDFKELDIYQKNGWFLFPIAPGTKEPIKNFKWTEESTDDRKVWEDWIERGWGLGLQLGKKSNIIAIDIDSDKTLKEIKNLIPETLTQKTKRGKHFIFKYTPEFDFLNHANLRKHGLDMEVRANNAYIVVAPTSVEGEIREWNNENVNNFADELKSFLLNKINKKNDKEKDELIQNSIINNHLNIKNGLVGLDGECNDTFIKLGGILRKKLSIDNTEWALNIFNQTLAKPMPKSDIKGMITQLQKYQTVDKNELAIEVLERLKIIKEGTAFQIAGSLKKDIKDVEDVLKVLEDEQKIVSLSNRKYKPLNNIEWTTETTDMSVPISFRMPYFHDYSYFDWGNMIIISAKTGTGKSHITGNIIKQLVEQGINPDLINTEAGSKIGKICNKLQVPKNSYFVPAKKNGKEQFKHPTEIELRDNKVTIIDWLRMKDGDWSQTENTFEHFHDQLRRHNGILIILTQLRKNGDYFATDLFDFFGAFVCKYLLTEKNDQIDNINTYFETTKIRDSKTGRQHLKIPTKFDPDTKILELKKNVQ